MNFLDVLKLPFLIIKVLLDVNLAALKGISPSLRPKGWGYKMHVAYTLVRSLMKYDLFDMLIQPASQSTLDIYRSYMKEQELEPEVVSLDEGAVGGWIGKSGARKVFLYLHGGAYTVPASPEMMEILGDLVSSASKQGKELGVFILEFGVLPKAKYPTQLIQAITALTYLIEDLNHSPENIFLLGDSSGGNLTTALLSSLIHPHPLAPTINLHSKNLAGVFLISPWVTFNNNSESMTKNKDVDFISHSSLLKSSRDFMGGKESDEYTEPLKAEEGWWKGLPVSDVCVLVGEYEIFLDDVREWVGKIKVHSPEVEFYLAPAEVHNQMMGQRGLGLGVAKSEEYFRRWVFDRL